MGSEYEERMEEVEEHLGTTDSAGAVQTTQHEVLQELKGKVVERVEYVKLDPDVFKDVLCIFFVDGTVLELEAGVNDLFGVMKWTLS